MKKEIWKKIKKYPYKVSNFGRIKRIKAASGTRIGKILKVRIDTRGYLYVNLYKNAKCKNFRVHKLVAEAFIGLCPKNKEINHIDGIKSNNNPNNLEYVTRSENNKHAFKLGLQSQKGEKNSYSKLKERDIKEIRKLYRTGNYFQKELAEKFNCSRINISKIVCGENWSHIN